jgi:hypothetical protein
MRKLWDDVVNILKAPFVGSLDIIHIVLLVGLVIVASIAWVMVLRHVRLAAEAVV